MTKISVIGGGAWGTALACVAAKAGNETQLWAREGEVVEAINERHENEVFLKGVALPTSIKATSDIAQAGEADVILMVPPAQYLRAILKDLLPHIKSDTPLVLCSKGIEQNSGLLMTDVAVQVAPEHPIAVLSGPTFAAEVARGLPTAVTIAAEDASLAESITEILGQKNFRPYVSDDIVGAEIGGAVKNVLAIACGIVAGRKLGENARASLITRGLAEMLRFGVAKGAKKETLMGLSGLGDLILTCSSLQSRNMSLGAALGEGQSLEEILATRNSVSEGAFTAPILDKLARDMGVDMPIVRAVNGILNEGLDVEKAMAELLSRPFRKESQ
ncbi:MAG: NAD(P)H-dependent glycerol-3-phosphate dehydrogenase [Sphingomonadales bacterium]|jgi:glycerol-3-phosphate dehydrogenase (NAD(P)+)